MTGLIESLRNRCVRLVRFGQALLDELQRVWRNSQSSADASGAGCVISGSIDNECRKRKVHDALHNMDLSNQIGINGADIIGVNHLDRNLVGQFDPRFF